MNYFENLARREYEPEASDKVEKELIEAGIPVLTLSNYMNGEVKTYYIGILNGFVFERMWRYWSVKGNMPLLNAEYLYKNYKDFDIRVAGHAGNPSPKEWSKDNFVDLYHVDTKEGLKILADTIKKNNIVTKFKN